MSNGLIRGGAGKLLVGIFLVVLLVGFIWGGAYLWLVYGYIVYDEVCWKQESHLFCSSSSEEEVKELIKNEVEKQVYIEGGSFKIGDTLNVSGNINEEPSVLVSLSSYSISKYETTWGAFVTYLRSVGKARTYLPRVNYDDEDVYLSEDRISKFYKYKPVRVISWYEAKSYCAWLAEQSGLPFDLPSSAQWEYAARSRGEGVYFALSHGSSNLKIDPYYKGYDIDYELREAVGEFFPPVGDMHIGRTDAPLRAVGSYKPNPLGLYDMSGNAGEWVLDWYDADLYKKHAQLIEAGQVIVDPVSTMNTGKKEVRDWAAVDGPATNTMVQARGGMDPLWSHFGFRCVVNSEQPLGKNVSTKALLDDNYI